MYFFILYVVMCATDMHSLIKGNLLACLLENISGRFFLNCILPTKGKIKTLLRRFYQIYFVLFMIQLQHNN